MKMCIKIKEKETKRKLFIKYRIDESETVKEEFTDIEKFTNRLIELKFYCYFGVVIYDQEYNTLKMDGIVTEHYGEKVFLKLIHILNVYFCPDYMHYYDISDLDPSDKIEKIKHLNKVLFKISK